MNTTQIHELLKTKRFPSGEYVYLREVNNGTGMNGGKCFADALAIGIWPSRGHHIHGIEIKVERGDWLRELKKPSKSHEIFVKCETWCIVAPEGVVKKEEVPPKWGWIVASEDVLKVAIKPTALEHGYELQPFVMSLLRNLQKGEDRDVQAIINEATRKLTATHSKELQRALDEGHELRMKVANFKYDEATVKFFYDLAKQIGLSKWDASSNANYHLERLVAGHKMAEFVQSKSAALYALNALIEQAEKLKGSLTKQEAAAA